MYSYVFLYIYMCVNMIYYMDARINSLIRISLTVGFHVLVSLGPVALLSEAPKAALRRREAALFGLGPCHLTSPKSWEK